MRGVCRVGVRGSFGVRSAGPNCPLACPWWCFGLSILHGAYSAPTAVLKDLKEGRIAGEDVPKSVIAVAKVAEEQMGGTSGALYSCVCLSSLPLPFVLPFSTPVPPAVAMLTTSWQHLLLGSRAGPPDAPRRRADAHARDLVRRAVVCAREAVHVHTRAAAISHARRPTRGVRRGPRELPGRELRCGGEGGCRCCVEDA